MSVQYENYDDKPVSNSDWLIEQVKDMYPDFEPSPIEEEAQGDELKGEIEARKRNEAKALQEISMHFNYGSIVVDTTEQTACKTNPELFYIDENDSMFAFFSAQAKKLCSECAVQPTCLTNALKNRERFGIWGGMTETERSAFHRKRF